MKIVAPTIELWPQLIEFYQRLTEEDTMINRYDNINPQEEKQKLELKIKEIETGNGIHFWAVDQNKIIGVCGISRKGGRSWHVGNVGLMIDRDFRREGIGRHLMEIILEKAKNIKLKIAILDLFAINKPAKKLYLKMGFRKYGCLPNGFYYQNKFIDKIEMFKNLEDK